MLKDLSPTFFYENKLFYNKRIPDKIKISDPNKLKDFNDENQINNKNNIYVNKIESINQNLYIEKDLSNYDTFKIENNKHTSNLILSPKANMKYNKTNLEEIRTFINPDPQHPNFATGSSEFSSSYKKRKSRNFLLSENGKEESNKKNSISNSPGLDESDVTNNASNNEDNYNSNFSFRDVNQALTYNSYTKNNLNNNTTIYNIGDFNSEKIRLYLPNFLPKKNFVFIYFEIINFNFCLKDYFKSIYPEINLVLILEINDSVLSQEKIFFIRADENIYQPILKKEDLQFQDDNRINRIRIIKPVEIHDENYPIKISFNFYTFTNQKLLSIGSEDLFFIINPEYNMQKFYMYQNIHFKYVSKKIGNLSFNYCYKMDEIYPQDLPLEMKKNMKGFSV